MTSVAPSLSAPSSPLCAPMAVLFGELELALGGMCTLQGWRREGWSLGRGVHVRPMTYANGKVWHETLSVEIEDGRETAVSVAHMSTADTVLRCFSLSALWDARRQNPPAPSPSLSPLQVSLPLTPTSFDDNACVLLNNKGEMMGTRVSGVVSAALRDSVGGTDANGRWSKILSLAPKVSVCLTSMVHSRS